jgi:predicted RNase H-like HicB family nuclease
VKREFSIRLTPADDGRWTAAVPALPGCVTGGETKEQALERIKEAVELYLEVLAEEGRPIPEDRSDYARIEIAL